RKLLIYEQKDLPDNKPSDSTHCCYLLVLIPSNWKISPPVTIIADQTNAFRKTGLISSHLSVRFLFLIHLSIYSTTSSAKKKIRKITVSLEKYRTSKRTIPSSAKASINYSTRIH